MRLRYTKRAAQQIDKSLSYIAEQSPQGAAHVRERLFAAVTLLQYRPYAGRATSRAGIRRFSLLPYQSRISCKNQSVGISRPFFCFTACW